ncbi:MAG: DUF2341 domain-containing protein, partial [Candidatus Omnitrophica bacterium]|nr:DUF2341 domain-containing protein [Candidatus Omnitrophota bacterium]
MMNETGCIPGVQLVTVPKNIYNRPEKNCAFVLRSALLSSLIALCFSASYAFSLPQGEVVETGSATFEKTVYESPKVVTVNGVERSIDAELSVHAADKTVVNFNSFSIAKNEMVNFIQPDVNASMLARVMGSDVSVISGILSANGIFFLSNTNGIHITETANINVNQFVATTLAISTNNFVNGNYNFEQDATRKLAQVLNEGKINSSGSVSLIGGAVKNSGVIAAKMGSVNLASGNRSVVSFGMSGLINVAVEGSSDKVMDKVVDLSTGESVKEAVKNSGTIEGHVVVMTAETKNRIFEQALNTDGVIRANKAVEENGVIKLVSDGYVSLQGILEAASGTISVDALSVKVAGKLDVTGTMKVKATQDLVVQGDIVSSEGDLNLLADSDNDGVGEFTQVPGTVVKTSGTGNVSIDGSGVMTLAKVEVETGAILIGTERMPDSIAGEPEYIRTSGNIDVQSFVVRRSSLVSVEQPGVVQVTTAQGDVLLYNPAGDMKICTPNGKIGSTADVTLPGNYLQFAARTFENINSEAITTHFTKYGSDLFIESLDVGSTTNDQRLTTNDGVVAVNGPGVKDVTYLARNNITFEVPDGVMNTAPGVTIPGKQVKLMAKGFGNATTPVGINADTTYINRIEGTIDISAMWGLGNCIMARGPAPAPGLVAGRSSLVASTNDEPSTMNQVPESTDFYLSFNKTTHLILEASKVTSTSTEPLTLLGDITFSNFSITNNPGKVITFEAGHVYTFKDSLHIEGEVGGYNIVYLRSSEQGKPWYIDVETDNYKLVDVGVGDSWNVNSPDFREELKSVVSRLSLVVSTYDGLDINGKPALGQIKLATSDQRLATIYASPSSTFGNNVGWLLNTVYWVGTNSANWSDAGNWSGGTPSGQDVAFDSTHSTRNSSTIDATITVNSLTIDSTWSSGTITQAAALTVTTNYAQAAGIFTGASQAISVGGDFSLSGGTFTSTSGTLSVGGNWSRTSGTFTHNSGTVAFTSTAIGKTITAGGQNFNNLTFSGIGGAWAVQDVNVTVAGNLTLAAGALTSCSGTLTLGGNWDDCGGTFSANGGTLDFNSGSDRTFTTLGGQTYNNLTHSGAGNLTFTVWQYRKAITIDHTKVPGNLTDFPVLISLSGLTGIQTGGTDIRFTASDGTTMLPREIESYSGGVLVAWVKTNLSSTADTTLYMYYGNSSATVEPGATTTYGSRNVWTNGYESVWHMTNTNDSDSNANNGTVNGSVSSAAGKIGNAYAFPGGSGNSIIASNTGLSISNNITVTAWIKSTENPGSYDFIVGNSDGGSNGYRIWLNPAGLKFSINYYGSDTATAAYAHDGQWYYIVGVNDGVNNKIYVNASSGTSAAIASAVSYTGVSLAIGDKGAWTGFNGSIDNVTISSSARSANWITTEYNNQSNPAVGGFYSSVGAASSNALTIAGTLTNSHGTFTTNGAAITTNGLVTVSSGPYPASSGVQTFNAGLTVSGGTFTGGTGTVHINGPLTISSGAFNLGDNNPTVTISGNITINGGTITKGTSTVTLNGDLTYKDNVGGTNLGKIVIGAV